ncbi:hypothetical protein JXR93_07255 [bacterium]|nr:hypothetical protein [bacterium]
MKFILFISVFFLISCQEIKPECHSGYILENESCVDIDECLNNQVCGNGFYCENLKGSYRCLDIDECSQNSYNCNINALCMNIIGSFICRCNSYI